jgi:urease accessory protein
VFTSSFGGGLVDGDRLSLDVEVGRRAAFLSTQASDEGLSLGTRDACTLRARGRTRGILVSLPDPIVCFADSRFDQEQTFELAADAALVRSTGVTSGRREVRRTMSFARYAAGWSCVSKGRLVIS